MCDYIIAVLSICEVRTDSSCAVPVPMWEWSTDRQFLCSSCTDVRVKYGRTVLVQFLYRCESEVRTDSSCAVPVPMWEWSTYGQFSCSSCTDVRVKYRLTVLVPFLLWPQNLSVVNSYIYLQRTLLLLAGREHCCYWPRTLLLLAENTAVTGRYHCCYCVVTLLLLPDNTAVTGR